MLIHVAFFAGFSVQVGFEYAGLSFTAVRLNRCLCMPFRCGWSGLGVTSALLGKSSLCAGFSLQG